MVASRPPAQLSKKDKKSGKESRKGDAKQKGGKEKEGRVRGTALTHP